MPIPQPAEVAALLRSRYSSDLAITDWQRVGAWAVVRARLSGAEAPDSVIVKALDVDRLRAERSALEFLGDELGLPLGPRVIAVGPGFLVLEDLAPRVALDTLLRDRGWAAHAERLAAFADARGRLGALTAGHTAGYRVRRARLGPLGPADDLATQYVRFEAGGEANAATLGAPIGGRAADDLAAARAELAEPGPFLALSNRDAEVNNALVHRNGPADPRLIDFEHAGLAHALVDAVCLHVPGPAWLWVRDPAPAERYRRALADGIPAAADDRRYGIGLAAACMSWALVRLDRLPMLDARKPGEPSRLQLVATLTAAADTADEYRALPHLAGWACRAADTLRRRWPDTDLDVAALPPYTPRQR